MARPVTTIRGDKKRWACEKCGISHETEADADKCCMGDDPLDDDPLVEHGYLSIGASAEEWRQFTQGIRPSIPDYALAAAEVLERAAKAIRGGEGVEDIAYQLLPTVRLMARRV